MKNISTVKLGLEDLSDASLLEKGRNHQSMITGNAAFTTPTPTLLVIGAACDAFELSIQEVIMGGGKQAYSLKRTRRQSLVALLKELAGYVQAQSAGDRDLILSTGFEVRRAGVPVASLAMPHNLRVLLTDFNGQAPLRWNTVPDANNYQVFVNKVNPDDESAWELVSFTSSTRYTVVGLESAKYYWFRVQAIGRKGLMSPLSKVVKALAA